MVDNGSGRFRNGFNAISEWVRYICHRRQAKRICLEWPAAIFQFSGTDFDGPLHASHKEESR